MVGAGMAADLHRRGALLAGARIVGVLGSSPDRSAQTAARWSVPALADLEALVASDADVVHIATPNSTHAPYTLAAIEAGKHVVCEKPLGMNLAEAIALERAATAAGVVATVPFVYRYHPMVREIRARRQTGELGELVLVHGSYLQDWMLDVATRGWRVDPLLGGESRAFADIGSHWCDLVEWVGGQRFEALTAQVAIAYHDRAAAPVTTEDSAMLLLRTTAGVLASCTVSQVAAGRKNRLWFELDGTRASAVFDQENPETAWFGDADGARVLARDPVRGSAEQRRLSHLPAGHAQGYAQCFEAFAADTYAAIGGASPAGLPTFADGVRSARIVDAVLRSARSTEWEAIV
ncbi:Gfo/Idh/MocA family oxidoreductase [Antrihabitans sp. YC2-6]|nr:Gfo/Idh/MocA family oxidoreductase [Antrihabitans sp. YC2-6]